MVQYAKSCYISSRWNLQKAASSLILHTVTNDIFYNLIITRGLESKMSIFSKNVMFKNTTDLDEPDCTSWWDVWKIKWLIADREMQASKLEVQNFINSLVPGRHGCKFSLIIL